MWYKFEKEIAIKSAAERLDKLEQHNQEWLQQQKVNGVYEEDAFGKQIEAFGNPVEWSTCMGYPRLSM